MPISYSTDNTVYKLVEFSRSLLHIHPHHVHVKCFLYKSLVLTLLEGTCDSSVADNRKEQSDICVLGDRALCIVCRNKAARLVQGSVENK